MTREEEISLCIMCLKHRILSSAESIKKYEGGINEMTYSMCEDAIEELQDLMKYINELEELNKD